MPFWTKTRVGPRNHVPVLDGGCRSPNGKGYFSWVVWAIQIRCSRRFATAAAFDAKTIIQSPLTICSRRDHSVCQASANRNPQNSECRRCDTSPGKGGDGSGQCGRSLLSTTALFCVAERVTVTTHGEIDGARTAYVELMAAVIPSTVAVTVICAALLWYWARRRQKPRTELQIKSQMQRLL